MSAILTRVGLAALGAIAVLSASSTPASASQGLVPPAAAPTLLGLNLESQAAWPAAARAQKRLYPVSRLSSSHEFGTVAYNKWFAREYMAVKYGWGPDQFAALEQLWERESRWDQNAHNSTSGAHGIPQALPGDKMAMFGDDWASNPETQIKWGLHYIQTGYGTPAAALAHSHSHGWY